MKEEKEIKVKLSTAIIGILTLIIIALVIAVALLYKQNMEKANTQSESTGITSKTTNIIPNTKTDTEKKKNETGISDAVAIKLAKSTYEKYDKLSWYQDSEVGPMPYILKELGLETNEQIEKTLEKSKVNDTTTYIKSNTKYEKFKQEMLKYMTEKLFNEKYKNYKNMNGYVGYCHTAAGYISTSVMDVQLISKNDNTYKMKIKLRDDEIYNHYLAEEKGIKEEDYYNYITVEFEYINGNLVVSNDYIEEKSQNEELKTFLGYVGYLNVYRDNNYKKENLNENEISTNNKIMLSSMYTKKGRKNNYVTYNLKDIKEAIKEIFNEEIDVEKSVKAKKCTIFYDSKIDAYIDGGGDESYSVYIVKIESQKNANGIYEVTFLYGYPTEGDLVDGHFEDYDCYRTTVKIKVNENYKYSKYQLVSTELSGKKVGKIKDFV